MVSYINGKTSAQNSEKLYIKPQTITSARKVLNGQYDVYYAEEEWQSFWRDSGKPQIDKPDGAFINFCKRKVSQQPSFL